MAEGVREGSLSLSVSEHRCPWAPVTVRAAWQWINRERRATAQTMPGQALTIGLSVLGVGALYVVLHEARRKQKKQKRMQAESPISKDVLLKILNESAELSKNVIEQIRVEVSKLKTAKNLSDEQAMQIFQQNFELQLDRLIGSIRKAHNVTEQAMDASFKLHQGDPEVMAAIQNMRVLSTTAAGAPSRSAASSGGAGASSSASTGAGSKITRDSLKAIMAYNATLLERELQPIKDEMARQRSLGKNAQVDPNRLMQLQARISEQVHSKFGVTEMEVMAAVDKFGAREDPGFREILERIASTLNTTLG